MTARILLAVAARVLTQLRRDRRTAAMLLVLPCALITLLWWMFRDSEGDLFNRFGPGLLAIFPFIIMFLVTSVTTLRERSSGTLERLLAMPMGIAALCALHRIPSRASLTVHFNDSAD